MLSCTLLYCCSEYIAYLSVPLDQVLKRLLLSFILLRKRMSYRITEQCTESSGKHPFQTKAMFNVSKERKA